MATMRVDPIEGGKTAVSRRPLVVGGTAMATVAALAFALGGDEGEPRKAELVLEPDEGAAERVVAEVSERPQLASPVEEENLGVHPVEPVARAGVSGASSGPTLMQAQQTQYEAFLLREQEATLKARQSARASGIRVTSFAAARRQEQQDAQALLQGMEGDGAGGALEGLPGMGPLAALASAPALAALGEGTGAGAGGDPGGQWSKQRFFARGGEQLQPGKLDQTVRAPYSEFELQMGSIIPGVLISGINSEAPGQIIGQVSENVYDSATGRHLLIPQGARLVGTYNAQVTKGQARVQVAWVRLNFPNGRKLDLEGMPGTDQAGFTGFRDRVNRHFGARLAAALMATAFTVAYEVTAPRNGFGVEGAVHRGVGESIVRLGVDMAREEGQRPPTLEIRPGYRFSISVNKDIVFPGPYEDGFSRRGVR